MVLKIETRRVEPDITVLEFKGRITLGNESQRIEPMVRNLLSQNEKKMIFDLSGVDYIDSTGIGIMAFCSAALTQAGGALRIAGAAARVEQVLKATRLDTIVATFPTVEAASQGF